MHVVDGGGELKRPKWTPSHKTAMSPKKTYRQRSLEGQYCQRNFVAWFQT